MKKNIYTPKNIAVMSVFVAVGLVLQYIEGYIASPVAPGGKLGLANIVSVLNIFAFGGKNAIFIAVTRAALGSLFSGGLAALPYSVAGAFFSVLLMCLAKKYFYPKLSLIGISIIGAAAHNIAQVVVAALVFGSGYVFSYISGLLLFAVVSGGITGYATKIFAERIHKEDLF